MKIDLPATKFEKEKKGDLKQLRRQGKIPAILYGHKEPAKQIFVDQKEFKKVLDALKDETVIVNLKVGGKSYPCVIKTLQQNPLEGSLLHIDFQHIHKKEKIRASVPVHAIGIAPGIEKGGILDVHLHQVEVRCLPDDLPSHIDIDISALDLGDAIHIRDLNVPNIEFELSADTTIVSVLIPRAVEVAVKPVAEEEVVAAEEGAAAEGAEVGKEEKGKEEKDKKEKGKEEKDKKEAKEDKKSK